MSSYSLNTNIEDYSIDELLQVLNLDDNPSLHQINSAATLSIQKVKGSYGYDRDLVSFLESARDRLIDEFSSDYFNKQNQQDNENERLGQWYRNEYLPSRDPGQESKKTDRAHQVEVWDDNSHFPMKQTMLGVTNSVPVLVSQDSLNPTLRNINIRVVNIDSQFRPNILPFNPIDPNSPTSATNFTFELSETLTKVLSIFLYSVQIPNTWYRFSLDQGNTCFKYTQGGTDYYFNLPPGNYDSTTMTTELNNTNNWNGGIPAGLSWSYNTSNSKFNFDISGSDATFVFYDISGSFDCSGTTCSTSSLLNQNLGWSLGFRPDASNSGKLYSSFSKTYSSGSHSADAVADLQGPKYFSIILDDYNQNRQNKGLVGIGVPEDNRLNLPSYYSSDLQFDCCGNVPKAVRTVNKKITQSQIYSINQILLNRNTTKQRQFGSNSSDVLAVLPLDLESSRGRPYTSFGSSLLANERRYYGPVDITKMRVRLVDDKGNTVNLNGADWSMSLIINELYQY